jgi:hypothetical protein
VSIARAIAGSELVKIVHGPSLSNKLGELAKSPLEHLCGFTQQERRGNHPCSTCTINKAKTSQFHSILVGSMLGIIEDNFASAIQPETSPIPKKKENVMARRLRRRRLPPQPTNQTPRQKPEAKDKTEGATPEDDNIAWNNVTTTCLLRFCLISTHGLWEETGLQGETECK